MQPLKFTKVLKEKVWGGREFESFLHIPLPAGKTFGESWEVSAHPNGPSVVAEGPYQGTTLPELLASEGPGLVGAAVWRNYGERFPLLIKYLDVHDKLSIQVHPDDEYAQAHEGEFGKSECWYVLSASPDAKLILGMSPGVTKDEFARRSREGAWDGLFREVPVAQGDFVHIVPGTVHASLTGSVLICEIQQNSDTTYRIYDFDRLENGKPRALHLDKALDVIRFDEEPRIRRQGTRERVNADGAVIEPLVADPHYTVALVEVRGAYYCPPQDSFTVWSVLDGYGTLEFDGLAPTIRTGDTWMVPAGVSVTWMPPLKLLRSSV